MTYVERRLQLRNGPPWGFRLYEDFMEGLIVSKIRKRSPAEFAGMQEGDHVLAINGLDALDMAHSRAVQIIDSTSYALDIIVGRYERLQRMETIYLDNEALKSRQVPQELTTTELQLFWEKEMPLKPVRKVVPAPKPILVPQAPKQVVRIASPPPRPVTIHIPAPPPPPQQAVLRPAPAMKVSTPEVDRKIVPNDPDVASVSVKQLMREFDVPPIAPELKKKNYADSSFYSDPSNYYPTIEEQMKMARRVAESLQAPENSLSRGVNMFEKQRMRAEKHVREGPDPEPDPIEMASPEELETMTPPSPPPPPPPPPPSFPGLQPVNKPSANIPPPPPLAPGQPKTVQEFLEKIKVFPTSKHSDIDPQKSFDIASALYTSDSRGAKMFAKRHARAKKWDSEADEESNKTLGSNPSVVSVNPEQIKSKLISKIAPNPLANMSNISTPMRQPNTTGLGEETHPPPRPKISLVDERPLIAPETPSIEEGTPRPFAIDSPFTNHTSFSDRSDSNTFAAGSSVNRESGASGWRPVKFKLAQAAN